MQSAGSVEEPSTAVPLLDDSSSTSKHEEDDHLDKKLSQKVWIESKKLWHVVGPAIFNRVATYSMLVITQAFAGHLGDLELAAMSVASNIVLGFNLGLLV
ncbi:unnamed protein product [Ilex paraguariensis]|uniref:Uncharacterized protein n=1 Tax=Ilex paraguariensis TaxID=185542 RepID=A0ABC8TQ08_9AQUA